MIENGVAIMENSLAFPQKLNHRITILPIQAILRLVIWPKEFKTGIQTHTFTFIIALFKIDKRWKRFKYLNEL
jgi:hypothetical protein